MSGFCDSNYIFVGKMLNSLKKAGKSDQGKNRATNSFPKIKVWNGRTLAG
jgi:hypothetical protein